MTKNSNFLQVKITKKELITVTNYIQLLQKTESNEPVLLYLIIYLLFILTFCTCRVNMCSILC